MGEVFEGRDFSESVFWGVNFRGSRFRDAEFADTSFFHTSWSNVSIDGEISRLTINGVDVTEFVNARDRWYPLRVELVPETAEGVRSAWAKLGREWSELLQNASRVDASVTATSVNGEWSLRDTLRHLLFAMDKWFVLPLLGDAGCLSFGLPNSGSQDRSWPGVDLTLQPTFDEVLAARAEQHQRFEQFILDLDVATLPETVEVLENGTVPALMCFHVVLEEEFEHLRYATRDLVALGVL